MSLDLDRHFLELTLIEAEKALNDNTYPVGAVIVDEENKIISKGKPSLSSKGCDSSRRG